MTSVLPRIGAAVQSKLRSTVGKRFSRFVLVAIASFASSILMLNLLLGVFHVSAGLSGVTVQFLGRRKGIGGYGVVGTRTTSGSGVAALAVKPVRNMEYIARYAGGALRFGRQTGAVAVLVRTLVKTTLSVTSLHLGKSVVIKGSVAPKHAGQKVLLQRLVAGKWKTIATVKLTSLSTYRFTWKPLKKGTFSLRVSKPADADHVTSFGPTRKLKVL